MSTRADIAHLGATGYELDTTKLSAEEIENIGKQVEEYKQTEELILRGDLYRIDNPFESNFFTEMVVSKDKSEAILCAYRRQTNANPEIKRIRLSGLDKRKMYRIAERDITASGATLMNAGMVIHFPNEDYISVVYHIREI